MNPENKDKIAWLAGAISELCLQALQEKKLGLGWQDVVFAVGLAAKGIASLNAGLAGENEAEVIDATKQLLARALRQPVLTKRFTSMAEMEQWMADHAVADDDPAEPGKGGALH